MCEFCLKHGEGQKWYLEARNYGEDLLSDLKRRKAIEKLAASADTSGEEVRRGMQSLEQAPSVVRRIIRWKTVRSMKKLHYGQIVPIEDVEQIFGFVNSITRVSCICRYIMHGTEQRYCYGISMGPNGGKLSEIFQEVGSSYQAGPNAKGVEVVTKEEALASFRALEKEGLCHSVWTFLTPFIGGICNCDRPDCLAMQMSFHGTPMFFRAEYVAETDAARCDGCRQCMRVCQFGAIGYAAGQKQVQIDPRRCYGCGICRSVCHPHAIRLQERAQVPAAAGLWQ